MPWRLLLAVVLALLGCLVQDNDSRVAPAWQVAAALEPPANLNLTELREESLGMFRFGYGEYMRLAFPFDDLRPISCRGKNSQGGIALTLIDSLDTLIVMGESQRLQEAVRWLAANATFDVDARVHVFELTIRAVGGLLSAHMLIEEDPNLMLGYDGSLLRLAVDLTDRFMPAFETPTGVPLSWVNLRRGQIQGDVRSTCTACAGTLLLEFGVLSRLTGNATYEAKARHAVETIFGMRSPRGLVGNTLDCDSGAWVRTDAGVGAGVDSFYEYLLKAYLAFGDRSYLSMFKEVYAAAMTNLQLDPKWNGHVWLVDVDMQAGQVLHPYVWSLGAFWPGLQALAGQIEESAALHANWTSAWGRFGWLPEMFDVGMESRHPTETGYPLRPELMESTFLLHSATGEDRLLGVGAALHQRLRDRNRAACGYASVGDVSTGQLEDTMESFFLSETVKYLYLLFSNASALVDHFVLSTEGHLLPPFPDRLEGIDSATGELLLQQQRERNASCIGQGQGCGTRGNVAGSCRAEAKPPGSLRAERQQQQQEESVQGVQNTCPLREAPQRQQQQQQNDHDRQLLDSSSTNSSNSSPSEEERWRRFVEQRVADKCHHLCTSEPASIAAQHQAARALRAALPLLPLPRSGPMLLRERRCVACQEVTAAVLDAERAKAQAAEQLQRSKVVSATAKVALTSQPAVAASGLSVTRQFLCVIESSRRGSLGCSVFTELPPNQISERRLNALPQNYMLIQITNPPLEAEAAAAAAMQQQHQPHVQQGCAAAAGSPMAYPVAVELQLSDGSLSRFEGMLADFGPMFEPGCAEEVGGSTNAHAGEEKEVGSSGSNSSGTVEAGEASAAASGRPPVPPEVAEQGQVQGQERQQWRGRALEVREGGPPGQRHRLVYVADAAEVDDDDPYEDPDDEEEEEEVEEEEEREKVAGQSGTVRSSKEQQEEENPYLDEHEDGLPQADVTAASGGSSSDSTDDIGTPAAAGIPSMVLCSVEGYAAVAQPLHACGPLQNAEQLAGRVAVVQRGSCMFVEKALAAERAGAVAVLVVNTEDQLMAMGTDQQGSQTDIATVLLPSSHGRVLLDALHAAAPDSIADGSSSSSSFEDGGSSDGSARVRLFSPADAAGQAVVQERCAAAGGLGQQAGAGPAPGQQMAQQVELLMSQQAQLWLFNKVSANSKDPPAAFASILAQIQAHFHSGVLDQKAGQQGAGEDEVDDVEEE